nr:cache domain-containing protein [Lachnospiraceae bacterium]
MNTEDQTQINKTKAKKLSAKLMIRFLPVIAIGIAVIIGVVALFSLPLIKNLLYTSLEQHVSADSGEVNKQLNSSFYYLNAISDSLEIQPFEDDEEIKTFMSQAVGRYDMIPTGVYLALSDGTYLDPTGWDPGKDVRESGWYKQGIGYDNTYYYFYDQPYFDSDTGNLCATVVRHIHLKDGRDGVLASDLMMSACQEYLNTVNIFENGHAIMITASGMLLSCQNTELCGKTAEESDDAFYIAISALLNSEDGEIQEFSANGKKYYGVGYTVNGTDWKVIDYALENDVLSEVYIMFNFIIATALVL